MKIIAPIFRATVENGKLHITNGPAFAKYIGSLNGDVMVSVQKKRRRRTIKQNAWYNGVILPLISEKTGETTEAVHEAMKMHFNVRIITIGRMVIPIPGTTTTMTTTDFSEFIERVRAFAASELDLNIPDPNPDWNVV